MSLQVHLDLIIILVLDYTLNNPDTLTKYKTAAQISHKVLEEVTGTKRRSFQ
jgi:methionine aminopeptidase